MVAELSAVAGAEEAYDEDRGSWTVIGDIDPVQPVWAGSRVVDGLLDRTRPSDDV